MEYRDIANLISQIAILGITVLLTVNIQTLYRMHKLNGFLLSELRKAYKKKVLDGSENAPLDPKNVDDWMTSFTSSLESGKES